MTLKIAMAFLGKKQKNWKMSFKIVMAFLGKKQKHWKTSSKSVFKIQKTSNLENYKNDKKLER